MDFSDCSMFPYKKKYPEIRSKNLPQIPSQNYQVILLENLPWIAPEITRRINSEVLQSFVQKFLFLMYSEFLRNPSKDFLTNFLQKRFHEIFKGFFGNSSSDFIFFFNGTLRGFPRILSMIHSEFFPKIFLMNFL